MASGAGEFSFTFATSDETELTGDIVNAMAGISHQTFKNVRFGLSCMFFDIDTSYGSSAGFDSLQYSYQGPALSIGDNF